MKNKLITIILIIFILFICKKNNFKIEAKNKNKNSNKVETYERIKLQVIDQSTQYPDFNNFKNKLLQIIKEKNIDSFYNLIKKEYLLVSYGGGEFDYFVDMWKLKDNPKDSKMWNELKEIIRLGFYYNKKTNSFHAPAIFKNVPDYIYDEMAPFEWAIVTEKNVNVRKDPSLKSNIIDQLSYEIVKVDDWAPENLVQEKINGEIYPWYNVTLYNGKKGYIFGKYIRSSGDYRITIEKIDNEWKITAFVAGI